MKRTEGTFRGYHGVELFFQTWQTEQPRGTLVVTHGMAEHSECYDRLAQAMVPRGWNIFAWDLRGHGRSEGKRGYVADFQEFSEDLARFVSELKSSGRFGDRPFALLGHSMGGLITLRTLIDHGALGASAACLSSPLLGVALKVPPAKDFAARVLNRFLPTVTLYNEIKFEDLSRESSIVSGYSQDPLRHEKISPSLYLTMLATFDYVFARAKQVQLPLLMQISGLDKIVSRAKAEELFPLLASGNKSLLIYEKSYHEIFNCIEREKVYSDLHKFLEMNLPRPS